MARGVTGKRKEPELDGRRYVRGSSGHAASGAGAPPPRPRTFPAAVAPTRTAMG